MCKIAHKNSRTIVGAGRREHAGSLNPSMCPCPYCEPLTYPCLKPNGFMFKPPAKKREFSETAMKETISRAKYADDEGNPVRLSQAYNCADTLHYDVVSTYFPPNPLSAFSQCKLSFILRMSPSLSPFVLGRLAPHLSAVVAPLQPFTWSCPPRSRPQSCNGHVPIWCVTSNHI